jgi:hypothetical protein
VLVGRAPAVSPTAPPPDMSARQNGSGTPTPG